MRNSITLICLAIAVSYANAQTGAPTEAQKAACKARVEKAIRESGKILGMGKGVAHLGGAEITNTETLENGKTAYTYRGGILTADGIDGYISGSGATTVVIFEGNSCKISRLSIDTGAAF